MFGFIFVFVSLAFDESTLFDCDAFFAAILAFAIACALSLPLNFGASFDLPVRPDNPFASLALNLALTFAAPGFNSSIGDPTGLLFGFASTFADCSLDSISFDVSVFASLNL